MRYATERRQRTGWLRESRSWSGLSASTASVTPVSSSQSLAGLARVPESEGAKTSAALWSLYTLLSPNRMLTRRTQTERKPDHFANVFSTALDPKRKTDKDEDKKVKAILGRLQHYGVTTMDETNAVYALRSHTARTAAPGDDSEAAFRLLMLLQETCDGVVVPYEPSIKLLGAVNRDGVTCYLDSLLFAMFAKLDSFEALLYDNYEDRKRKRLAGLLRLWVNMLRTGKLIHTDVTKQLQGALADCGWSEASKLKQQDPSEAFGFITSQLELPLLTLKMDLYHTGKEDPQDDHKFINERLLEVALLDKAPEGRTTITLEDCLEHYFNNRIEVKRHMEWQRRNTIQSSNSGCAESEDPSEKSSSSHIEVAELAETPTEDKPQTVESQESPIQAKTTVEKLRPTRGRAASIFSQRKVTLTGIDPEEMSNEDLETVRDPKSRNLSTKTEVLMPAWQFFKLLPWYTDNAPTSDAQVAAHFSRKRPVLGICLKRYSYTTSGDARRLNTYIDIPLEITVPNFVSDDSMEDDAPLGGNFRLLLQSVVCHRGVSVHSGHYISLVRGKADNAQPLQNGRGGAEESDDEQDPWLRFDDLGRQRVSYVDIHKALKEETPYLLFYQVQPIGEPEDPNPTPPSYNEAISRSQSDDFPVDKPTLSVTEADLTLKKTMSDTAVSSRPVIEATDFVGPSTRTSLDAPTLLADGTQHTMRTSLSNESETQRHSISFDQSSFSGHSARTDATTATASVPSTPSEEKSNSFFSVASKLGPSRRSSRTTKTTSNGTASTRSRPGSSSQDAAPNRFSLNMSKLTARMSRGQPNNPPSGETAGSGEQLPPLPSDGGLKIQPSAKVATELEGQKDVSSPAATPSADDKSPDMAATTLPLERNDSLQTVLPTNKVEPAVATKVGKGKKKERGGLGSHKSGGSGQDDRECAVM